MLGFPMCAANATTCGMAVLPPGPKGGWQCVVQPVPAASRHVLNYGYGRVFLGIAQAGPGSAGDAEFVTATQSGALGVCIPPNRDGMRHTPTYVLSRLNTDHTTRKRPDSSIRWKNLDNSGVLARADSSSEWMDLDAGKPANVSIPPVTGGFGTFGDLYAGVFLQWVEVFGL